MDAPTLRPVDLQDRLAEAFIDTVAAVIQAWQVPLDVSMSPKRSWR